MPTTAARTLPDDARRSLQLYNLLFPLAFLALLPGFLRRMFRRGGYRENFGQRLGRFSAEDRTRFADGQWIWIHSISVGETLLAMKLAQQLLQSDPAVRIALSTTTSTGHAQAMASASDRLKPIYNPLDLRSIVRRTLNAVRPARLVFIEAMWPNLLAAAAQAGIPVTMIPRLSPRSERRFRKFRWLVGPIFRLIDRLYVQDASEAERWQGLGVAPECIEVTGNIKFDAPKGHAPKLEPLQMVLSQCRVAPNRPVLLGGSTFPGEEAILGRVLVSLRRQFPDLFLIVVPRHVERSAEAETDLTAAGLRVTRRSNPSADSPDCLLVDTTGELRDWYYLSTVVFIGKSLTATGGQNPVEAVIAGKPVIYGPYMENFRAVVDEWKKVDAALQVRDETELKEAVTRLLKSPTLRDDLAGRAAGFLEDHTGATGKIAAKILQL